MVTAWITAMIASISQKDPSRQTVRGRIPAGAGPELHLEGIAHESAPARGIIFGFIMGPDSAGGTTGIQARMRSTGGDRIDTKPCHPHTTNPY